MNLAASHISTDRLALCSWSLQPTSPCDVIEKLRATGINRIQLALDSLRESPTVWGQTHSELKTAGIEIISGMFGCLGEDYSTLESIRDTGGLAPDATWKQNLENIHATAAIAATLQLRLVTFHAGFLPHEESDPRFGTMIDRLQTVAEIFAARQITLGLETGQETAPDLARLLGRLNHPNVGVNFDPANMILYGKGDPIAALHVLSPWIRQVHIKDARRTKIPGTWGEEVVAGTGDVDWKSFFKTLNDSKFTGNFVIEREAGTDRIGDIRAAREMVRQFFI